MKNKATCTGPAATTWEKSEEREDGEGQALASKRADQSSCKEHTQELCYTLTPRCNVGYAHHTTFRETPTVNSLITERNTMNVARRDEEPRGQALCHTAHDALLRGSYHVMAPQPPSCSRVDTGTPHTTHTSWSTARVRNCPDHPPFCIFIFSTCEVSLACFGIALDCPLD